MKSPQSRALPLLGGLALAAAGACVAPSWQSVDAEGFACHVERTMDASRLAELAEWTSSDLRAVAELLNHPVPDRPLDIYCGRPGHHGGRLRTTRGEVGRYMALQDGGGRIELVENASPQELRGTLRHELAHHLVQGLEYSEWLNEGMAEFAAFELAESLSSEDIHHLLHAGPTLAAWYQGLAVEGAHGTDGRIMPRTWLPSLPDVLRMDYPTYAELVLRREDDGLQPEFHAVSHLLVRVLLDNAGEEGPARYSAAVRDGEDPWIAYQSLTGLFSEAAVIESLITQLTAEVTSYPNGEAVARDFAQCACMQQAFPEQLRTTVRNASAIQCYPGGPLYSTWSE